MSLAANAGSVQPSRELQRAVKEAIDKNGLAATTERLGVSRSTLAAMAAGLHVRKGTLALAAVRLGLDAGQEADGK
jgi:hypothetical protein